MWKCITIDYMQANATDSTAKMILNSLQRCLWTVQFFIISFCKILRKCVKKCLLVFKEIWGNFVKIQPRLRKFSLWLVEALILQLKSCGIEVMFDIKWNRGLMSLKSRKWYRVLLINIIYKESESKYHRNDHYRIVTIENDLLEWVSVTFIL